MNLRVLLRLVCGLLPLLAGASGGWLTICSTDVT